jgi:hypothetical protein
MAPPMARQLGYTTSCGSPSGAACGGIPGGVSALSLGADIINTDGDSNILNLIPNYRRHKHGRCGHWRPAATVAVPIRRWRRAGAAVQMARAHGFGRDQRLSGVHAGGGVAPEPVHQYAYLEMIIQISKKGTPSLYPYRHQPAPAESRLIRGDWI